MRVLVLGAGVVGVASAWFLREAGHDVVVVDRQPGPALETSFANGGQISASHAEPWANPAAPGRILRWIGQPDAPLLFRPRADLQQWLWCAAFLRECRSSRTAANIRTILALALHSRDVVKRLRRELALEYDCVERGILHFYTDRREFEASRAPAALMRTLGCHRRTISAAEAVVLEPALAPVEHRIVGADYCAEDESGDAHRFTQQLAQRCVERGVQFRFGSTATSILLADGRARGAVLRDAQGDLSEQRADATLVCLGVESVALLRSVGQRLMIYPGKGYSATFDISDPSKAPPLSLTDDEFKLVLSRFGSRLRVAGTAEIAGWGTELDPLRCEALTRRTAQLFPGACDYDRPNYWAGRRPVTPSNVPYLGHARIAGLFLNTGHGTLGWTLGPGNGELIAQAISGTATHVPLPADRR
ncbi:MAG TPA: D-amino acid dehydrogenase [Burkholderiaceae bacterium]|nr:D-amino acid dehydrogenase [Burkholderiaceae bacterium]